MKASVILRDKLGGGNNLRFMCVWGGSVDVDDDARAYPFFLFVLWEILNQSQHPARITPTIKFTIVHHGYDVPTEYPWA